MKTILFSIALFICIPSYSQTFDWVKFFSGDANSFHQNSGVDISIDNMDNVHTCGSFLNIVDFDPNASIYNIDALDQRVAYVSKLDNNGDFVWAGAFSPIGNSHSSAYSICTDTSGNVYTTGIFDGVVDFDPGINPYLLTSSFSDAFISKLDANGNFVWAKRVGGSLHVTGNSIKTDEQGNVYIAGTFRNTVDFDPGPGTHYLTAGGGDSFLLKLDSDGIFQWVKQLNATGSTCNIRKININFQNEIILVGNYTDTVDFDPGNGVVNHISNGSFDSFTLKLNNNGDYLWSKTIGGHQEIEVNSVISDPLGSIYSVGSFFDTIDFNPGIGVHNIIGSSDKRYSYILKLDVNGDFVWVKIIGNPTSTSSGLDVAIDMGNQIYATGYFNGTIDFNSGTGVFNLTSGNELNTFISKLNSDGDFMWAGTFYGINSNNYAQGIAIGSSNNIFTTGWFSDEVDFDCDLGSYTLNSTGGLVGPNWNSFVHKINQDGVDISENNQQFNINIFPNPARESVTIDLVENIGVSINLYNSIGELVLTRDFNNSKMELQLDYPDGVYFLQVNTLKGIITKQIVKM